MFSGPEQAQTRREDAAEFIADRGPRGGVTPDRDRRAAPSRAGDSQWCAAGLYLEERDAWAQSGRECVTQPRPQKLHGGGDAQIG